MLYLDNSATTQVHPEVKDAMLPYLMEEFGNPSSKYYSVAENAKNAVKEARNNLASLLGCSSSEVIFTSGSTESNNMIIKGVADYYSDQGNHIITTKVEHPSVLETCRYLETKGFEVTYLDVDHFGRINIEDLKKEMKGTTILVSVIWGNNELGSLNDMKSISNLCLEENVFLHSDATQVIGKIEVDLSNYPGLTFLSFSGHKFHGPKGIGGSFIRKDQYDILTKITPLLHGGGQELGIRSGTLAVHNIVGFGKAAELANIHAVKNRNQLIELENYLTDILKEKFNTHIVFNNDVTNKIPGIISVQFKGVNNEILVKKLSPIIAVSTGSACSSSKPSHVLAAIGLSIDQVRSTIRFSLSSFLSIEDLVVFNQL
ncbi:aminotransferase class V-fold PLP-dependent enzyme [Neobacillus drentensis]|uniref:cysteine desulfurase family protein n=1 Tax=Neobacillus drentensis TaxID=220684 RepID=UPI001F295A8E|nr:aminotransferase class V-fold PLP-dependent enzyme [Neobacillus drentensis]ULT59601.1 aminotransferase class V-fold PLP-dependent enzyme [Neobacillus drentensis]